MIPANRCRKSKFVVRAQKLHLSSAQKSKKLHRIACYVTS